MCLYVYKYLCTCVSVRLFQHFDQALISAPMIKLLSILANFTLAHTNEIQAADNAQMVEPAASSA